MAEQEVKKHTRKIINLMNDKNHSTWSKIKEFAIEIVTIVFAISLSIWFHQRSEHNHQQEEVTEFLKGLATDLKSDLKEINSDKKIYQQQHRFFSLVALLKADLPTNPDSLNRYANLLFGSARLVQNNGRFEGFKASGKIGFIENLNLQDDIMNLYQEEIPQLLFRINIYDQKKDRLIEMVEKNYIMSPDGINVLPALKAKDSQIIALQLAGLSSEIIRSYKQCEDLASGIVEQIEKAAKDEH